jgi:formate/nitrite transporter FocA (FNT family)
MKPAREKYYRVLFTVSAIYDFLLGITFMFFAGRAFAALGISDKLPAIRGYLKLLGAFVLVIGIAYILIARGDLRRNADLILVGTLYKLAYAGTAIYYWTQGSLPHVAFGALFGVADAVFFVLMAECYWSLEKAIKG